jgi:ACS family D-galactonate transporter-like MFS transporter
MPGSAERLPLSVATPCAGPGAPAAHAGRWLILGLLILTSATNQFHRTSLAAVGDQIMRDHSISAQDFGTLNSVFIWSYTLLMTPGGWLADRVGTWWTILLVLGGSGLFGGLSGMTGWLALGPTAAFYWIASARAGMGIASAPIYPSTSRTVASWFRPRLQPLANALVIAAAPLGMAASFEVLSWLSLSTSLGWRGSFLCVGAVTIGVAALWAVLGQTGPGEDRRRPSGSRAKGSPRAPTDWGSVLRHKGILALTLSYTTVGYFEYLLFYWMKHYYKEILKLDEDRSANYTFLSQIAMMVFTALGGWICGRLVSRWGLRRGMRAMAMSSMVLASLFLLGGALATTLYLKVALLSLSLGFIGACEAPFWTSAVILGGPLGATVGGFVNTGGNLLGGFAPMATPWIASLVNGPVAKGATEPLLGWTVALAVGSIVCLMGVLLWLWVDVDRPLQAAP